MPRRLPRSIQYSTFSLWDTYRAQHVLLNLLEPRLAPHFAASLLAVASASRDQALPRWVLYGVETGCMSGYPAAVVLADLALKNLSGPALTARAYEAMKVTPDSAIRLPLRPLHPTVTPTCLRGHEGCT